MKNLHKVAFVVLVIGGLNWLLFALLAGQDIGSFLGGQDALISRAIYVLVGLAAIVEIVNHKSTCKACSGQTM